MRKSITALLVSMLLAVFCAWAGAEEAAKTDLFDLWDYGGESMTWIAPAVPVSEGAVIVSPAALQGNTEHLAVSDGKTFWEARAVLQDDDGLLAVVFYDQEGVPERCEPWTPLGWGESAAAEDCVVLAGDARGSRVKRGVMYAQEMNRGRHCVLLSLTGPAAPGSPVLTEDGRLAGIVVAEWAEGTDRVLAVTAEEVFLTLAGTAARLQNLPAWQDAPEGLNVAIQKNLVTIDWKELPLPEKPEGTELYLVVMDTGNDYLVSYPAETEDRSLSLLLVPGRFYLAGVMASAGIPDRAPETYAAFGLPVAKPLTENSFRPLLTAIAEAPEDGLKEGEAPVPVSGVTEELLRSGRAYFYSSASYEVTERMPERTLLITLTDPYGICYRYESGWIYAPEYMPEDTWYLPLRETGLTAGPEQNNYPKGIYRMAYYVDGDLADAFEFELK